MNIYFVSIFPDIYNSFINTSLIEKARGKNLIDFEFVDPREYTNDKHRQIDDEPYGIGSGMVMKARPLIDALEDVIAGLDSQSFQILMMGPSKNIFDQEKARSFSQIDNLIFVSGRYEGIDYRFYKYMKENYENRFQKISLGRFITMGGETASMVMSEAIIRLLPGVIKQDSIANDSYNIDENIQNIEHPQYTRPREVYDMKVPDVLLSGNHKKIKQRKKENTNYIDK